MSRPPLDSTLVLPLPAATSGELSSPASGLESKVIDLFDELRGPLFRYVLSFRLSVHDSEDIIQEVFLSLFRHLQLGRPRQNLRGWVFRVAHNLSLKRRSANHKYWQVEDHENAFRDGQQDPAPSAEEQLVLNERQMRLSAVLQALPEQDQRCLRLRAEGLRYREIAEVEGLSLGAVSISLTRSLARLGRAAER